VARVQHFEGVRVAVAVAVHQLFVGCGVIHPVNARAAQFGVKGRNRYGAAMVVRAFLRCPPDSCYGSSEPAPWLSTLRAASRARSIRSCVSGCEDRKPGGLFRLGLLILLGHAQHDFGKVFRRDTALLEQRERELVCLRFEFARILGLGQHRRHARDPECGRIADNGRHHQHDRGISAA